MTTAERAPAVRSLRLAIFASVLIATLRLALNLVPALVSARSSGLVDALFDLAGLLALAAIVHATFRLARTSSGSVAKLLTLSLCLGAVELTLSLMLWIIGAIGGSAWHLAELSLVALLAWAGARGALFMGMFGLAAGEGRAPPAPLAALVPLAAGARAVLFLGSLLSPYLEAGGESRRIFLSTAELRGWLAFAALIVVESAIAWLAGRRTKAS